MTTFDVLCYAIAVMMVFIGGASIKYSSWAALPIISGILLFIATLMTPNQSISLCDKVSIH